MSTLHYATQKLQQVLQAQLGLDPGDFSCCEAIIYQKSVLNRLADFYRFFWSLVFASLRHPPEDKHIHYAYSMTVNSNQQWDKEKV